VAAKKEREARRRARQARPVWWGEAAKGSTLCRMKLRPANMLPGRKSQAGGGNQRAQGGAEETKGQEAAAQQESAPGKRIGCIAHASVLVVEVAHQPHPSFPSLATWTAKMN